MWIKQLRSFLPQLYTTTERVNHWSVLPPFSHDTIWPAKVISLWTKLFQFGSREKPTTLTDLYLNIRTTRQNICPFVCSCPWTTSPFFPPPYKRLAENQCLDTRVVFVCALIKKETQKWGLTVPGISWCVSVRNYSCAAADNAIRPVC